MGTESVRMIQGDCLDILPTLEAGTVDLTVTSPPYDNLRTYNGNNDKWNESVWKGVISELFRVTKDGGVVVWVVGDATINGSETGTSFRQALWAMDCGFNTETMIWEKTGQGAVGSCYYYWQNFEYMFVWSKGRPKTFNLICDRKNQKRESWSHGGRDKDGVSKNRKWVKAEPFGKRFNLWKITPSCKSDHPAPFPLQLAHDHIISWSNEGDTVIDCFMGSGSTGVACVNTRRNFIGIELDAGYFQIAEARIQKALDMPKQQELFT